VVDAIFVRKAARGNLWFSREGLYKCIDFVEQKTRQSGWHYSGELDLIFVSVGETWGIDWTKIAYVDVATLIRQDVYPSVQRLMPDIIAEFRRDPPTNISAVYNSVVRLPLIKQYTISSAKALAKDAPKIILDAVKLYVGTS
jgi:hypothetical protein